MPSCGARPLTARSHTLSSSPFNLYCGYRQHALDDLELSPGAHWLECRIMDERIEVSLDRVRHCIQQAAANSPSARFSTADVIRAYLGHFHSDLDTPPVYSFNAQFGKLLKRNAEGLGIVEDAANQAILDDAEHMTSTSLWQCVVPNR